MELAARAYFRLCLTFGRALRSTRYSSVEIVVAQGGAAPGSATLPAWREAGEVRKHRLFYAPVLVALAALLLRVLDTGVRVLPQRAWHERERLIYARLRGTSVRVSADGVLVRPLLPGHTLAMLLEDRTPMNGARRKAAIEGAAASLAEFHRLGFTHGDAMAENVLVDLDAGVAHWFDFETVHDTDRPLAWRRADDVRALLATCLTRTAAEQYGETLDFILAAYADPGVTHLLSSRFTSVWARPLAFHLAQAPLSFQAFREVGRLLRERHATRRVGH